MSNQKFIPAQKFFTPLDHAIAREEEQYQERVDILSKQYGEDTSGSDRNLDNSQRHDYSDDSAAKKKNFDQKIYMFPESFNALRRELHEYWPTLFYQVNPETGTSLAHDMVFDAAQFIGTMNGALDLTVQFDTENVSGICHTFLNALRAKRGLSPIQA